MWPLARRAWVTPWSDFLLAPDPFARKTLLASAHLSPPAPACGRALGGPVAPRPLATHSGIPPAGRLARRENPEAARIGDAPLGRFSFAAMSRIRDRATGATGDVAPSPVDGPVRMPAA
jgi:hypothetical protein